ncbi:uncharacterized protein LOC108452462 isoform X3 [Gossypium arboreum]|uniref:uncharacterized protein LOC108452462 isoform X3 n=1 Tax=Gossypium arboreum TaxID=29729 RepID=UPI0022F17662|nr:uncharacterized protein LOC108452462 isoform X3 [Gossypium arboreum]
MEVQHCAESTTKTMAYLQPLIFYILSALPIFWLISPSLSSLDNVNDKVTVSLYYETSLCPRCASFISNDLVKVFHTDLHTIINLRLVPWSNAEIHCQDFENFVKYVCQAYKGDHKPAACKAQSSNLSPTIYASFAVPQPPVIPVVDFYKLALQWPPSVCSSTLNCKLPIPTEFKIHGIWAQDAHDMPVPPYNARNPCTHPQPTTTPPQLQVM